MPRLAVLIVLSAASSPCPDLNLIHYKNKGRVYQSRPLCLFQTTLEFHAFMQGDDACEADGEDFRPGGEFGFVFGHFCNLSVILCNGM